MILLDTNVISEFTRAAPSEQVTAWFRSEELANIGTTTIAEAEVLAGLVLLPEGKRKEGLIRETQAMLAAMGHRVFSFDRGAAQVYPLIVLQRKTMGFSTAFADGQIASIARLHGASIATRNVTDFQHCGVEIINPWTP